MPTGFTWTSYQAAVVTQIPSLVDDENFQTMLPDAIDYAELSLYRDLDFLALHGTISLGNATVGTPTVAVPSSVVVLETLYFAGVPLTPASRDYIQAIYAGAANGVPLYFATLGAASGAGWTPTTEVLMGPAPNAASAVSAYVTQRQAPLSATNTETFISMQLPDAFWSASMIFWSAYTKNFGAQADDPKMAMSWSSEYQRIIHGANKEELRKKFMAYQGTAFDPGQRAGAAPQGAP